MDKGDSEQVADSKWKAFVESWFSKNHTPCVIADWHGKDRHCSIFFEFFIVCGLVLQNKCRIQKLYDDSDLFACRPCHVSAAVHKQHKKFYQRKSANSKEHWYANQVALESFGASFSPKVLRSLPNPPVAVMQVAEFRKSLVSRERIRTLLC